MNPFDYVNSINDGKDIIRTSDSPAMAEKGYNPYMTNRALSYFPDTVMFANEMNTNHWTDGLLQYDYLINIVRKRKRFSKWFKPESDDLETIKEYYKVGSEVAKQYLRVLSADQLANLKTRIIKGG
jgi:hypothetical protein